MARGTWSRARTLTGCGTRSDHAVDIVEQALGTRAGEPPCDIVDEDERLELLDLFGTLKAFDRRACNRTLRAVETTGEWSER